LKVERRNTDLEIGGGDFHWVTKRKTSFPLCALILESFKLASPKVAVHTATTNVQNLQLMHAQF
jgi:hypothetical protein